MRKLTTYIVSSLWIALPLTVGAVGCSSSSSDAGTGSPSSQSSDDDGGSTSSGDTGSANDAGAGGKKDAGSNAVDGGSTVDPSDGGVVVVTEKSLCEQSGYVEVAAGDYQVTPHLANGGTSSAITSGTEYAVPAQTTHAATAYDAYAVSGARDICVSADMKWVGAPALTGDVSVIYSIAKYSSGSIVSSGYQICATAGASSAQNLFGECDFTPPDTSIALSDSPLHISARMVRDPFGDGSGDEVQGQVRIISESGVSVDDGNPGSAGGGETAPAIELDLGLADWSLGSPWAAATIDVTNVHVYKR